MPKTEELPMHLSVVCAACSGAGKKEIPIPPKYSEAYEMYMRGEYKLPLRPCKKCKQKGSISVVNPTWLMSIRESRGVTREAFATSINVTYGYICNIESGRSSCTPSILEHYQALLNKPETSTVEKPIGTYNELTCSSCNGAGSSTHPCSKCNNKGVRIVPRPEWLVQTREQAGLSRKDVALALGRTYVYIANIENGYSVCTDAIFEYYQNLITK